MAVHCGLREGELLGLKWEDVDLEVGTLQVRRTPSDEEFTPPKTAKSRRSVGLTPTAVEALKRHSKRQAQEMVRADTLYQDLVFTSLVGTPLRNCLINQVGPAVTYASSHEKEVHN